MYVFPGISSLKRKASFLAYMVNGLLLAYIGHRRCDNRDDFRNKRLELATKLLKHELKVHIAHAQKRMSKALRVAPTRDFPLLSCRVTRLKGASPPHMTFLLLNSNITRLEDASLPHVTLHSLAAISSRLKGASPLHVTLRFPTTMLPRWPHLLVSRSFTEIDPHDSTFLPNESVHSLVSRPFGKAILKRPRILPKDPALPQKVSSAPPTSWPLIKPVITFSNLSCPHLPDQ
ncbi:DNA-directed RNA polymerases IV and V subunit 2, partial [Mucuna pruriens]